MAATTCIQCGNPADEADGATCENCDEPLCSACFFNAERKCYYKCLQCDKLVCRNCWDILADRPLLRRACVVQLQTRKVALLCPTCGEGKLRTAA